MSEVEPCKTGYDCPWGRRESAKVVCSMPRCVMTDDDDDKEFRFFERMMQSGNTYERRNGKVKQKRFDGGG